MTPSPEPDPAPAGRHLLLIEGDDPGDALLRVLGVVSVQQARLSDLSFTREGGRFEARAEIAGLDGQRAEHLRRRLAQLPVVKGVSLGWRA
jgi:hypothetical protein